MRGERERGKMGTVRGDKNVQISSNEWREKAINEKREREKEREREREREREFERKAKRRDMCCGRGFERVTNQNKICIITWFSREEMAKRKHFWSIFDIDD